MATPLNAVLPWYGGQFFDNNGDPLASGKVFFYLAGTATKTDTYSDTSGTANTNPVVLDSSGRATIFLSQVTYKIIVATSTAADPPVGAQIIRTIDGVSANSSLTNTSIPFVAGESIAAGQWIYMSDGSLGLTAGRWYLTDADNAEKSTNAYAVGVSNDTLLAAESGTCVINGRYELISGTVLAGSNYYLSSTAGSITDTAPVPPAFARVVAKADTTTSIVISQWTGSVLAGVAGGKVAGLISNGEQDIGGLKQFYVTPEYLPGSQQFAFSKVSGVLEDSVTASVAGVGNVGASSVIGLFDLSENTLSAANGMVRITAFGHFAASASNKTVSLAFGATTLVTSATANFTNQGWRIVAEVIRVTSTTQTASGQFTPSNPAAGLSVIVTQTSPTENLASGDVTIAVTGASSTATNNEVLLYGLYVETLNI